MRKMIFNYCTPGRIALSLMMLMLYDYCEGQLIVRGGPTIATISFTEDEFFDYSMIAGFGGAVGYEIPVKSSQFTFIPEISFTRKGAKERFDTYFTTRFKSETKTKIDYLEIPLLLRFTVGKDKIQPFATAGVSISYGIGGRFSNTTMEQDPFPTGTPVYKSRAGKVKFGDAPDGPHPDELYVDNRLDYGIQLGAGVLLFKRALLDVRYALGLKDLYDKDESLARVMSPGKNRVFMFSVGYRFNLQ